MRGESVSSRSLNEGPDSSISKVYPLSEGEQGFKDDFEVYCLKDAVMTRLEWKWVVPEEGVDRCLVLGQEKGQKLTVVTYRASVLGLVFYTHYLMLVEMLV